MTLKLIQDKEKMVMKANNRLINITHKLERLEKDKKENPIQFVLEFSKTHQEL